MTTICNHTYDEYLEMVRDFHGHVAPGMVFGGYMVDLAQRRLPREGLFDAICETRACLPDSLQILTPCTIGNGWLKVLDFGRFALTLYDKFEGRGVRVFVDPEKLEDWPEVKAWFFKLKTKQEQSLDVLMDEIRQAGHSFCGCRDVRIRPDHLVHHRRQGFSVCASCGEAYPKEHGPVCRACLGGSPYENKGQGIETRPLRSVPVQESPGLRVLHDMTRIVPGREKGPLYRKGAVITDADLCRLQKMGRQRVYVAEENPESPDWVFEDDAAVAFAEAMAGPGTRVAGPPREGKAEVLAATDGLFVLDSDRLEAFNLVPGVACATRHGFSVVRQGEKLAGTRALPIYLQKSVFHRALGVLRGGTLFSVRGMKRPLVGILVTGTEVFQGLVRDRFAPVIAEKVRHYGCAVAGTTVVPDDREAIREAVHDLLVSGAGLIVTTAGLSVDPDDVTRQGLLNAGAEDLLYGAPILPGNMTLLARVGNVPVIGVPACALFHGRTSLDLLLPRILAGVPVTREDLASMGEGGMCLDCPVCTFPECGFGK
ncbi:MAG: FmdE family protein [Desulfatibacillaceae bacterium]